MKWWRWNLRNCIDFFFQHPEHALHASLYLLDFQIYLVDNRTKPTAKTLAKSNNIWSFTKKLLTKVKIVCTKILIVLIKRFVQPTAQRAGARFWCCYVRNKKCTMKSIESICNAIQICNLSVWNFVSLLVIILESFFCLSE